MAADQYCLKWNNHQSTLLVQFETLLESDSLTDCTLSAEGKYLNVHKVLLSACSPYFSKLLGEHKDKHPIFFMKDVAFEELKGIVEYMYKGEVNIMQERLDSFLKTASSLQIKGLADQDGGKGDEREEMGDPGGGRVKRKQAPDLRGGYGEQQSPMPEEPPRSPKRRRRPRPVSQDDSLAPQDQNHCDTTTAAPSFASQLAQAQQQQEVVMPTPLVPVKKTEPVDNSMVHLKTEIPDDVPQVDVQDLTLDDDEDFNNEDITQPGTSFSETSQDFAQWQQQMATQSGADESFMTATQGINQSGSQGRYITANAAAT